MESDSPNSGIQPRHATHGNNLGLTQAYKLRNLAAEEALALRECPADDIKARSLKAGAIRDLTAVWNQASERIRIIRGRPLPGSLKPKSPTRKRKLPAGPLFFDDSQDSASTASTAGPSLPTDSTTVIEPGKP